MTPRVAVLDYGIGNLRSAQKALCRVGADARLTADVREIAAADAVVLPGVGNFGACMRALHATGLAGAAADAASSGRPFLGICVGMQLLCRDSTESPEVRGLGVFDLGVRRLEGAPKLPQMQWNRLEVQAGHPVLDGLGAEAWMYFVHSYVVDPSPHTVAVCDYGGPVTAAVARENVVAVQFHPEKSGRSGLALIANFVRWSGASRAVA